MYTIDLNVNGDEEKFASGASIYCPGLRLSHEEML
jgi:hypothetical protein